GPPSAAVEAAVAQPFSAAVVAEEHSSAEAVATARPSSAAAVVRTPAAVAVAARLPAAAVTVPQSAAAAQAAYGLPARRSGAAWESKSLPTAAACRRWRKAAVAAVKPILASKAEPCQQESREPSEHRRREVRRSGTD